MANQDFRKAMSKRRGTVPVVGDDKVPIKVVGEFPLSTIEELEKKTQQLPVVDIAVEQLGDNPYQHLARAVVNEEALQELVESIKNNGFYGALLARRKPGTSRTMATQEVYELAYGHRRREAARRAGLTTLPVKVVDLSNEQMAQVMASENFSREDLTPLGEANVIGLLYTQQNMSVKNIAAAIGKGRGWVEHRVALFEASQDIKEMVEQKPDSLTHVRWLTQVSDKAERSRFIDDIVANRITRDELQNLVQQSKKAGSDGKIVKKGTKSIREEESDKLHNQNIEGEKSATVGKSLNSTTSLKRVVEAVNLLKETAGEAGSNLSASQKKQIRELIAALKSLV